MNGHVSGRANGSVGGRRCDAGVLKGGGVGVHARASKNECIFVHPQFGVGMLARVWCHSQGRVHERKLGIDSKEERESTFE